LDIHRQKIRIRLNIDQKWGFDIHRPKNGDLAIHRPKMEIWLFVDQKMGFGYS
jgi:hypothetical protein